MIPKNTSLVLARIPVGGTKKTKDDSAQAKAQKWYCSNLITMWWV
jgi:hypothetical protein